MWRNMIILDCWPDAHCFFVCSQKISQRDRREKCCLFGHTLIKVETENYEQYLEYIGAGKMTVNKFLLITAGFLPSRYNRSNPSTISKFQDYYRKPEKIIFEKLKLPRLEWSWKQRGCWPFGLKKTNNGE